MLIVGDFNYDQMLLKSAATVDPLMKNFNLSQCLQYSTRIHGGLLYLVFDTSNSNAVSSLPSPYSDPFVPFFKSDYYICIEFIFSAHCITCKYLYTILLFKWWKQSQK